MDVNGEPTQVERVADSVWRLPLIAPTLPPARRTNTYLLTDGPELWVVDPGSPRRAQLRLLLDLLDRELPDRAVTAYVVTHHHRDHWGGLDYLLPLRPAPVVAQAPERLARLPAEILRPSAIRGRAPNSRIIHTPGHASDHLVVLTPERDVLAGDLVAGVGTVVINPPDGRLDDYLDSLRRLITLRPRHLFPAHGPAVEDGLARLQEYLAHRLMREEQVLHELQLLGPARPSALVPGIYPDIPLILRPVAARSVLAHLIKLEAERRVVRVGGKWRLS